MPPPPLLSHYSCSAAAEAMFRKAVSTIEGVKSDAVFSYQAPFNLIAVGVMVPLKLFLGPRYFHKVNVLMIRASAFPILICISCVPARRLASMSSPSSLLGMSDPADPQTQPLRAAGRPAVASRR